MELAIQLGFRSILFETHCIHLIQAWKKRAGSSYLFPIVRDCYNFVAFFDHVNLSYTRRGDNSVVDFMARNASSLNNVVWVEDDPLGLWSFLTTDVLADSPT